MKKAQKESRKGIFALQIGEEKREIRTTDFIPSPDLIPIESQSVMYVSGECVKDGKQVILEINAKTLNGAHVAGYKEWAQLLRDMADKIERVRFI